MTAVGELTTPDPSEDTEYLEDLGKDSDYLEDLARILENLGGLDTLAQELIQNAEDAKAERMRFAIEGDALVVDNDADFSDCKDQHADPCPWKAERGRPCDLHAFRRLSGASKRGQAGTIGMFGIGFTAVYQITDRPELISAGQHFLLDETLEAKQRAKRCKKPNCARDHGRRGTRFILPWARTAGTPLRTKLRVEPVTTSTPGELLQTLRTVIPRAMVFLRHLRQVEVISDGVSVLEFERTDDGGFREIDGAGQRRRYLVRKAGFGPEVASPVATHEALVEGRSTQTQVALPLHGEEVGLLYAGLPTHDQTGLPFHINAEFFPADDRRSLRWNSLPHARWNAAAIGAAGQAAADSLLEWRDLLEPERLWKVLVAIANAASNAGEDERATALGAIWSKLRPVAEESSIAHTHADAWVIPKSARRPDGGIPTLALDTLSDLDIAVLDSAIAPYVVRLTGRIDVPSLGLGEVLQVLETQLQDVGVCDPQQLPAPFDRHEIRDALLKTLGILRAGATETLLERLATIPIGPEQMGRVGPITALFRCPVKEHGLFRRLDANAAFLDEKQLKESTTDLSDLAPLWDAAQAVTRVSALLAAGVDLNGDDLNQFIEWLAKHETEIRETSQLKQAMRALEIWPTSLDRRSLDALTLPAAKLDRLPLAETLDLTNLAGLRTFFSQTLAVKTLDIRTYCCDVLPRVDLADQSPEVRRAVIETLGSIKHEVIADEDVLRALRPLPLVECADGAWRPVAGAYSPSEELAELLGSAYPQAALDVTRESVTRDVLEWLGLSNVPRPDDLLVRIDAITKSPPKTKTRTAAHKILEHLATRTSEWDSDFISELKERQWMTADESADWHCPPELYQREDKRLFASQALFADVPNQREKGELFKLLEVRARPETAGLVVQHLLWLATRGDTAPWAIYEFLDSRVDDPAIDDLINESCLRVDEAGTYAAPSMVFESRNPFPGYRWLLPARLRVFTRLVERLRVPPEPDGDDATEVLREIAEQELTEVPADVVRACWRMLQQALNDGSLDGLSELADANVALDAFGVLQPPASLLFNDAPTLAERLGDSVERRLISRAEDTWRALHAAGIRNLSEAATVEIVGAPDIRDADAIGRLLKERAALFARVVEGEQPGQAMGVRERMALLRVDASSELRVRYLLDGFELGEIYKVGAAYDRDGHTLYLQLADDGRLGAEAAKELVRALAPEIVPHRVAAAFLAILAAERPETAEEELDELDVPRLEEAQEIDWQLAGDDWSTDDAHADEELDESPGNDGLVDIEPSPSEDEEAAETSDSPTGDTQEDDSGEEGGRDADDLEPAEGADADDDIRVEPEDAESQQSGERGAGTLPRDSGSRTRRRSLGADKPRNDAYLETFLVVEPKKSSSDIASPEELESLAIDNAGTSAVLEYENASGRDPLRKAHSFPGYDVESFRGDDVERYIEIKSIDGPWDAARARLSVKQFETAADLGDEYWLYVVEHARTAPRIWRIQDPARRAHGFAYIPEWKRLAEADGDSANATPEDERAT